MADMLSHAVAFRPEADGPDLEAAILAACGRVAPLWPLKSFVAVNPFLGYAGEDFAAAIADFRRILGADMLMPRAFHRRAFAEGRIADADLEAALARAPARPGAPRDLAELKAAIARDPAPGRPRAVVATVAEVLDRLAHGDRQASRTAFMIDEISRFCAAYFDEGQAAWRLPVRAMPLYPAWREAMRHDRNPEAFGIRGFRAAVAALPADPVAAIGAVVAELGIPARAVEDYLVRALYDVGGWSAYVRGLGWSASLAGGRDDRIVHLLAIRLVWGWTLFRERTDAPFRQAWAAAMREAARLPDDPGAGGDPDLAVDLMLQDAYEAAWQRRLLAGLAGSVAPSGAPSGARTRPSTQAAFCIDVRSEVFRRALETVANDVETIGFAGFFGFAIEYVPLGHRRGGARCPVLLEPSVVVCEAVGGAGDGEAAAERRRVRGRVAKAWKAFKTSAVSSFGFVETAGLGFAAALATASAGRARPVPRPEHAGLAAAERSALGPSLAPSRLAGRPTGLPLERRIDMAAAALTAMSLTTGFGRLVLLAGHGATTVNNPHAAGLDCGACGGHAGDPNARVAAMVLNDPAVRAALAGRGITIPDDTWFLAGLHDTTTDEVTLFDLDGVPAGHAGDVARLRAALERAGALARLERAAGLGIEPGPAAGAAIAARSRDWSEVRPEWGLAGNAAFVAAPRARTAGLDLGGRAFLHSYDWTADEGFRTLELIMAAPMVVASWINLQYYGSTVNNRVFGAGNKVLHNVVGTVGVLEGNGGDLRTGLPLQSVHDGGRFVHEPIRLHVAIEAPAEAIDGVIARQEGVRRLVDNRWIHLFAIADDGAVLRRLPGGGWEPAA